jgi:hypothetical protein
MEQTVAVLYTHTQHFPLKHCIIGFVRMPKRPRQSLHSFEHAYIKEKESLPSMASGHFNWFILLQTAKGNRAAQRAPFLRLSPVVWRRMLHGQLTVLLA